MDIKTISIKDIVPYKRNAKTHPKEQIQHIANSLEQFGWKQPIVLDENMEIIAGHGRYLAAKQLKMNEAPCVIASDLTEEQVKAYRLADNKTNESEWDFSLLDTELELLTDTDIFDMSDFGFDFEDDGYVADSEESDSSIDIHLLKCPECGHENDKRAFANYD